MTIAEPTQKIAVCNANPPLGILDERGNLADMSIEMFEGTRDESISNVEYKIFEVYKNEIPSIKELLGGDYIGIHITGSTSDAHDLETEWINNFRAMLQELFRVKGHPPVSAICFGHQIVASALGCKVLRNSKGYEGGIACLEITEEAISLGLFKKLDSERPSKGLFLAEAHYDIVQCVPDGFIKTLSSSKCDIQGFYKKNVALTFQSHPDFSTDICLKINKTNYYNSRITDEELAIIEESGKAHINDGMLAARSFWKLFKGEL